MLPCSELHVRRRSERALRCDCVREGQEGCREPFWGSWILVESTSPVTSRQVPTALGPHARASSSGRLLLPFTLLRPHSFSHPAIFCLRSGIPHTRTPFSLLVTSSQSRPRRVPSTSWISSCGIRPQAAMTRRRRGPLANRYTQCEGITTRWSFSGARGEIGSNHSSSHSPPRICTLDTPLYRHSQLSFPSRQPRLPHPTTPVHLSERVPSSSRS